MDALTETLLALIEPVADAAGFDLVRVRVSGRQKLTLQVMAEKADGTMTAENCATLSRALSEVLDEADPISADYVLEVSSPGIDRPLTRQKDYDRWAGYEAKLQLRQLIEGRKRFRGVLAGIDGDNVCVDLEGEDETTLVPFSLIEEAKLILTDDLIRESLKAASAGNENNETEEA